MEFSTSVHIQFFFLFLVFEQLSRVLNPLLRVFDRLDDGSRLGGDPRLRELDGFFGGVPLFSDWDPGGFLVMLPEGIVGVDVKNTPAEGRKENNTHFERKPFGTSCTVNFAIVFMVFSLMITFLRCLSVRGS